MSETGQLPDCLNGNGCLLGEELATDTLVEELITAYLTIKNIPIISETQALKERVLKKSGLINKIDTLIGLESTYYKYKEQSKAEEEVQGLAQSRCKQKIEQG